MLELPVAAVKNMAFKQKALLSLDAAEVRARVEKVAQIVEVGAWVRVVRVVGAWWVRGPRRGAVEGWGERAGGRVDGVSGQGRTEGMGAGVSSAILYMCVGGSACMRMCAWVGG